MPRTKPEPPAKSATHYDWAVYAINECGAVSYEAWNATKDELIEQYGKKEPGRPAAAPVAKKGADRG